MDTFIGPALNRNIVGDLGDAGRPPREVQRDFSVDIGSRDITRLAGNLDVAVAAVTLMSPRALRSPRAAFSRNAHIDISDDE